MGKGHKGENALAVRRGSAELCQHLRRIRRVAVHPSAYTGSPGLWQLEGDAKPWLTVGEDCDTLQRLSPCSLGCDAAPALCLWDLSGLIKGGRASSRGTSPKHRLHVQCSAGPACQPSSPAASAPGVLSESNHFPESSALNRPWFWNCSSLPPTPSSFPKMPADDFPRAGPRCASPRKPEMQFVVGHLHLRGSDSKPFLRKGHSRATGGRGSRGTCVPCVRVTVTAGAQPELSLWPPELAGTAVVLPCGVLPVSWVQTQPNRSDTWGGVGGRRGETVCPEPCSQRAALPFRSRQAAYPREGGRLPTCPLASLCV